MKKGLIVIITAILIAGVAIFAVIRKKKMLASAKAVAGRPVPVSVAKVHTGNFATSKRYVGVMAPVTTANVSARITSEVEKVLHHAGERVPKGTLLIKLDDRSFIQSLDAEKAQIENVKTQIAANNVLVESLKKSVTYWQKQAERDEKLNKENIVPAKQVETSREKLNEVTGQYNVALQNAKSLGSMLAAAESAKNIAETNISYANIVAPFDCIIADVPVDPGDLASPGKKLMVLEEQNKLKVIIRIPQVDMHAVKLGDKITIESRTEKAPLTITRIYPSVGVNKMVRVEAVIPNEYYDKFVSGQYVLAYMDSSILHDAMIIPSTAINIDNNPKTGNAVFKVVDKKLIRVPVQIDGDNETEAAVHGDLKPGDEVVVTAFLGWAKLADGVKVIINPTETTNKIFSHSAPRRATGNNKTETNLK